MSISMYEIGLRLFLSICLSGLIGYEREHTGKPAGFRTHILVCIGASTVMLVGLLMFDQYHAYTNMDPTRFGAQVVSGIGFLGAGTIIREGVNVKGLTTSASIWAVGCIGLAIGSGYYALAIMATLCVFVTLKIFGHLEINHGDKEVYDLTIVYTELFDKNAFFVYLSKNHYHMQHFSSSKESMDLSLWIHDDADYLTLLNKLNNDDNITSLDSRKV
ncbi:MAG: MgtC/SapB family protein [Eubacteriales bacterium]